MDLFPERIKKLKSYKVQAVEEGEIKLDAQENPYPVPEKIREKIRSVMQDACLNRYPDPGYTRLKRSDELLLSILLAGGGRGRMACSPEPTFAMYRILSCLTDTKYSGMPLDEGFELPADRIISEVPDIVFIAYPNNPTGNCFSKKLIRKVIENSSRLVVIDEAYYEFSGKTFAGDIEKYPNLLVLRTFSKAFSLAGIRAGYVLGSRYLIQTLRKVQLPYNMSTVNQRMLEVALSEKDGILVSVKDLIRARKVMYDELNKIKDIEVYPSQANFLLMKINRIGRVLKILKKNKIRVREFSSPELKDFLRVTVGTRKENRSFVDTLKKAL
jgi:histidinol-phosphate aminotransferase